MLCRLVDVQHFNQPSWQTTRSVVLKGSSSWLLFCHRVSGCHRASYNKVTNYCWCINPFTFHLFHGLLFFFFLIVIAFFNIEAEPGWLTKQSPVAWLTVNVRENKTKMKNVKHWPHQRRKSSESRDLQLDVCYISWLIKG